MAPSWGHWGTQFHRTGRACRIKMSCGHSHLRLRMLHEHIPRIEPFQSIHHHRTLARPNMLQDVAVPRHGSFRLVRRNAPRVAQILHKPAVLDRDLLRHMQGRIRRTLRIHHQTSPNRRDWRNFLFRTCFVCVDVFVDKNFRYGIRLQLAGQSPVMHIKQYI